MWLSFGLGQHFHFNKAGSGIQEVGGNPENGPPFGIATPQQMNVAHIALLGKVGLLQLLPL